MIPHGHQPEGLAVKQERLDDLAAQYVKIDFLKLDHRIFQHRPFIGQFGQSALVSYFDCFFRSPSICLMISHSPFFIVSVDSSYIFSFGTSSIG